MRTALLAVASTLALAHAGTVEVLHDNWGVPHIYATDNAAMAYGYGYSTAEDHGAIGLTFCARSARCLLTCCSNSFWVRRALPLALRGRALQGRPVLRRAGGRHRQVTGGPLFALLRREEARGCL